MITGSYSTNTYGRGRATKDADFVIELGDQRWYGRQRRSKDLEDLKVVLAVQLGKLDLAYIRSWADKHGTREIFETLQATAEKF